MNIQTINKGTIHLNEQVVISDPCYELGVWCQIALDNVLEGNYRCFLNIADMGKFGKRVASMEVINLDHIDDKKRTYYPEDIPIGVDSGTAGIWDYISYKSSHTNKVDEQWYDRVVMSLSEYGDTVNGNSFVATSGFGDGSYLCWVAKNEDNKIIAIEIEFIGDEEDM